MSVPITPGTGASSVAGEVVGGLNYQQIEVLGGGGASVLGINPDGSIRASIIGTPTVTLSGAPSISGAVTIIGTPSISGSVNVPNTVSVAGAVQIAGASPASVMTVTRLDNQVIGSMLGMVGQIVIHGLTSAGGGSYVDVKVDPSGALVIAGSSVVSFQGGTQVTSLVSTVPSSVLVGASVFGIPNPLVITGSVQGTTTGNSSVTAFQGGNWITSVVSTVPSSFLVGASVFGIPNPLVITGSVQGTTTGNSSVTAFQGGTWAASIVGAPVVADNSAWAEGNVGLYTVNVRNDTLSSVSAADVRYSPAAVGQAGEMIVENAPLAKWVSGTADLRGNSGGSVTVIAAQGASIFTYITGLQLANLGSASVLVTLSGATSSVIGYTVAPAGGGSNIVYINGLKTNANAAFSASISGVASVLVSAQGFISKT